MANFILAAFNSPNQITEEELYSDEFYILVFSAFMSEEEEVKIEPGKTQQEKVENLKLILTNLAQVFQGEIPDIDPKKIIMKKDKENAKKTSRNILCFDSNAYSRKNKIRRRKRRN
jgi:hypothetical protein